MSVEFVEPTKQKRTYIPTITEERLYELAARMQPIVKRKNVFHYVIVPQSKLKSIAFTWIKDKELGEAARNIEPFWEVITYHSWSYYGFFKPSVAEVVAQLNDLLTEDQLNQVIAFETQGPETSDDLNKNIEELNDGYHVARTILYRKT